MGTFVDLPQRANAAAVEALAAAFLHDLTFIEHFWAGEAVQAHQVAALFRGYYFGHVCQYRPLALQFGEQIVAVANVAYLQPQPGSLWLTLQAILARQVAKQVLPAAVLERIQRYHAALYFPGLPCFCINQLGVAPAYQGQGYGRQLLQEILRRSAADVDSEGVLVTTYCPEKAAYYQRQGFAPLAARPVGDSWAISLFAAHRPGL